MIVLSHHRNTIQTGRRISLEYHGTMGTIGDTLMTNNIDPQTASIEVLVVEDEPADANLIRGLLSPRHDLTIVRDGQAAVSTLRSLESNDRLPELLLLDLRLPDMSGFDILKKRGGELALGSTPVVIFTNSDADPDRERALELGADEFITKPMDIDAFEQTIREIEEKFLS